MRTDFHCLAGLVGGLACLATLGCSSATQNHSVSVDPLRSGLALEPFLTKYQDARPQLSADGLKVVFVSGRDSTDTNKTLKIYKAAWPSGAAPAAPTRATATEIGVEQAAALSPDGNWIAIVAFLNGQTDLYLQDYAGAKAPVQITSDVATETLVSFSPDSKMLVWATRAGRDSAGMIVAVGDGTAATLAVANQMALPLGKGPNNPGAVGPSKPYLAQLFWLPMQGATYTLGEGVLAGQDLSIASYYQVAFTDAASAKAATATTWIENFPTNPGFTPVVGGALAILARKTLPGDNAQNVSLKIGDGIPPTSLPSDIYISVDTEPVFLGLNAGATPVRYPVATNANGLPTSGVVPGFQLLAAGISGDGQTVFQFDRKWFLCAADNGAEGYGTGIDVMPTDINKPGIAHIFPRLKASTAPGNGVPLPDPATPTIGKPFTEAYDLAKDPCDRARPDGSRSPVDITITGGVVNANASAAAYRIAYGSRFSPHFSSDCVPKTGDPEIMLFDGATAAGTVYPLSNNQFPQIDDDRGGSPTCPIAN